MAENPATWGPAEHAVHKADSTTSSSVRETGELSLTEARMDDLREENWQLRAALEKVRALALVLDDDHNVLASTLITIVEAAGEPGPAQQPHPGGGAHVCSCGRRVQ